MKTGERKRGGGGRESASGWGLKFPGGKFGKRVGGNVLKDLNLH